MVPQDILETCLYVDDLARAERVDCDVLGLTLDSRQENRHVFLKLGGRMFLLFRPQESELPQGGFPPHGTRGAGHVCFACREADIEAWQQHLRSKQVAIEHVHTWPGG